MESPALRQFATRMLVAREKRRARGTNTSTASLTNIISRVMHEPQPLKASKYVKTALCFLDLPFEIRLQIYRHMFTGVRLMVHTHYKSSWETSFKAHHSRNYPYPLCISCQPPRSHPFFLILPKSIPHGSQNTPQFLLDFATYWNGHRCYCYNKRATAKPPDQPGNLLQTCHQIQDEFLDSFYSQVAVQFNTIQSLSRSLPKSPHNHLNFIRTIDISWDVHPNIYNNQPQLRDEYLRKLKLRKIVRYYKKARQEEATWELACETLSNMPLLSNLKIMILDSSWKQSEATLLKPLLKIEGLKSFLVMLPWLEEDAIGPLFGELPFTVVRPTTW